MHPYRSYKKSPETAAEDYALLRNLIEKHAPPAKKNMPIISGEWGYSTFAEKGISLEAQAAFFARQQLANLFAGVPISIWYDWKNDGPDPTEREHNFGIVTADSEPKPAYIAAQTLSRELSGYRIEKRSTTGNPQDWVILFSSGAKRKIAAWTTGEPHVETFAELPKTPMTIPLTALPQYIDIFTEQ